MNAHVATFETEHAVTHRVTGTDNQVRAKLVDLLSVKIPPGATRSVTCRALGSGLHEAVIILKNWGSN